MPKKWRIAGIDFDHMHMGDNLRMAHEHPNAEIVGICDENPARMAAAIRNFGIGDDRVFSDFRTCIESTKPDIVVLCPATARHGEWVEKIASYNVHVLVEKPFAATLAEADLMMAAMPKDRRLAINWPLAWYPPHRAAKAMLDAGAIGDLLEVHFYDGNRGPLWHLADKEITTREWVDAEKPKSWFYKRAQGGGSLLDYLGYGTTLGTWYQGGRKPIEVTAVVDSPACPSVIPASPSVIPAKAGIQSEKPNLEVDEHSITIARYAHGLSKFETRWGTFTDPWTHQPQPKCGFVLVGTEGTVSSYDFEPTIRIQTREHPEGRDLPVDSLKPPFQNPIQYFVDCLERDLAIEGPLSPEISRIGQQIVDTAFQSAQQKRTLPLIG